MKDDNFNSVTYESSTRKLNGAGIFFLVTTLVFLGAGVYLFAHSATKAKEAKTLSTELTTSENRYADLDAKYTNALAEIESYKGKNAALDSLLISREKAITDMRATLNKEKKQRQLSQTEYKAQLDNLNTMIADLSSKIDALQKENGVLIVRTDSLGNDIFQKQTTITQLQTTNTNLSQKVAVASLLIPSNIVAEGTRDKSNGKEVETSRASKAQHLNVCFDIPQNKVSDAGSKTFIVRILSPEGTVLAAQDQSSNTFTRVETNEQMQYTTTSTIDYQQHPQAGICTKWSQSAPFHAGNYTAEIYQDGYLIGTQSFTLK